ncbi:Rne/Rng family ribonuclease [Candidatus Dependentiae bacterium]|nr:Rne/Rng family ribonuclease [Candidatus Dependentiae bacterium]
MKRILINKDSWQTRVAVMNNDRLQDIYFDTHNKEDLDRCFFKGRVSKVLPGIQTAFVDIGQQKAGFLHITEIDRALAMEKVTEYMQEDGREELPERVIKSNLDVGKIFNEGEDILVQVIKEPIHEKGAKLSTCFTLPGKFLVLMPNIPHLGVSKKIENREVRNQLRELMQASLPPGMGAIVRTNAEGRDIQDIVKDLAFLISTWKSIQKKFKKANAGEKIHEDLPVSLRAVRDHLDEDVDVVICDDQEELRAIHKFIKYITPEHLGKLRYYSGPPTLYDRYDIDNQLDKALQKKVQLKSGGSIIIESTEAMTVIDVNTGKFTGTGSLEETILKTNLEAAEELVTQLRLRNIGGLIVIDFIDMASSSNRGKLSRTLERCLKEKDKFQSVTLKISEFGLVQMTRKRSGKTLLQQLTNVCASCSGCGFLKSVPSISFQILRTIKEEIRAKGLTENLLLMVSPKVFDYLIHQEYQSILQLEKNLNCKIMVESNDAFDDAQHTIKKM